MCVLCKWVWVPAEVRGIRSLGAGVVGDVGPNVGDRNLDRLKEQYVLLLLSNLPMNWNFVEESINCFYISKGNRKLNGTVCVWETWLDMDIKLG